MQFKKGSKDSENQICYIYDEVIHSVLQKFAKSVF